MNAFSGVDYLPSHPIVSPISIVDIFFPGFTAVSASAEQLLANDVNGYVRLLCYAAVFVLFARYAYRYANDLIKDHFNPTIHIYYYDEAYEMITSWIQVQPFAKEVDSLMARVKTRQQTVIQDQGTRKKPLSYSPWDGSFHFWYKNRRLTLHCHKKEHHEEISISCIGRSPNILIDLMNDCRAHYLNLIQQKVPVFQPEGVWYSTHGIPYKRGYLFDGPPGTGKSSFCLSIASLYDLDIYILNLSSVGDDGLSKLFSQLPPRCIVILEDVDAVGLNRKDITAGQDQKDIIKFGVSLSGLLNVIDGVGSQEGRILIMSTNHMEHLDEALIRPGRVDKTVLFKSANKDIITRLFCAIFRGAKVVSDEDRTVEVLAQEFASHVPEEVFSPAEILSFFLEHKNSPADAVNGAQEWVAKQKELKTRLSRENSWMKDV